VIIEAARLIGISFGLGLIAVSALMLSRPNTALAALQRFGTTAVIHSGELTVRIPDVRSAERAGMSLKCLLAVANHQLASRPVSGLAEGGWTVKCAPRSLTVSVAKAPTVRAGANGRA
jgi:hypothetical protein